MHRNSLLASEIAVCYYCFSEFSPSEVIEWCDENQTAICPYCAIDAVVGFDGAIDKAWVQNAHQKGFNLNAP